MYQNLKAELARAGITQAELAKRIGTTPSYLSQKLTGKYRLAITDCIKIRDAIGCDCTIDYLFERSK